MRLGELLVATGAIRARDLEAALRHQVVYGGRLGTNLIELGFASADAVAHGLARLHRVPAALERHFAGVDRRALERVSRELASAHVALPIAFAQAGGARRLVVCLRDPGDGEALRALGAAAGLDVVASVAPELSIFAALARRYALEPPQRFLQAGPGRSVPLPEPERDAAAEEVDIDLSDLDDEVGMPAQLDLVELDDRGVSRGAVPAPVIGRKLDESPLRYATDRPGAVGLTVDGPAPPDRPAPLEVAPPPPGAALLDVATPPPGAAPLDVATPPPGAAPLDVATPPPGAALQAPAALDVATAIAAIEAAEERSAVSDAVLGFLAARFPAALLLVVKDEMALGYRGFGGRFTAETVEAIVLPLAAPSILARAHRERALVHAPPSETRSRVQDRFLKLFPGAPPRRAVVAPVVLRGRVVTLIYAHAPGRAPLSPSAFGELARVTAATESAFLRLIRQARSRR